MFPMKARAWLVLACALLPLSSPAQQRSDCGATKGSDATLDAVVGRVLESPGFMDGFDAKELRMAGDAATVTALRMIDPAHPVGEAQAFSIVEMISEAFSDLDWIGEAANRNPGVSLFFLRGIAGGKYSAQVKTKARETIELLTRVRQKTVPAKGVR
jgi:hypothetical protein